MTHLGSRLSALLDGQLPPAAAERALGHVAACAECAEELAAARATRRALAAAMDVPVAPGLEARLLSLRCSDRERPAARDERWTMTLPGDDGMPSGRLRGDVVRARTGVGLLALSGVGVSAVLGVLLVLGEQPEVTPDGHLASALSVLGQAPTAPPAVSSTGVAAAGADVPGNLRGTRTDWPSGIDPTAPGAGDAVVGWLREGGWAAPTALPDGYRVTGLRAGVDGPGSLELSLVGPDGLVVVTEREGRLDDDAVAHLPVEQLGDHTVHVLSTAPWHGVWQQGDAVVDVVTGARHGAPDLVAAYPSDDYDDGVGARLTRGWATLAGAWTP